MARRIKCGELYLLNIAHCLLTLIGQRPDGRISSRTPRSGTCRRSSGPAFAGLACRWRSRSRIDRLEARTGDLSTPSRRIRATSRSLPSAMRAISLGTERIRRNARMPNIKYCIDHVLEKATRSRSHTFALRTLTDARPAVTGKSVTVTSLGDQSIPSHKVTVGDASGHIQVNMGTLHAVAAMISGTAFARTQYGNSADDVLYRA